MSQFCSPLFRGELFSASCFLAQRFSDKIKMFVARVGSSFVPPLRKVQSLTRASRNMASVGFRIPGIFDAIISSVAFP